MIYRIAALVFVLASPLLGRAPAGAIVHLWDIAEIYSNEDGSVQFVELFTQGQFEIFTQNSKLDSGSNSVTLLGPVTQPTTDRSFLLATPGFAELPGAVVPDTVMPVAPFFSVNGDELIFQGLDNAFLDSAAFGMGELPLDGVLSLHRENPGGISPGDLPGGLLTGENSPTNYLGEVGHLMLPEPGASLLGTLGLLLTASLARRRRL